MCSLLRFTQPGLDQPESSVFGPALETATDILQAVINRYRKRLRSDKAHDIYENVKRSPGQFRAFGFTVSTN
ncbi:hypothetical protein ACOTTU_03405 [Roseobacter sp. EG26]|uniref:hypothetical protein n=1 Tax=Roseobacter sp. EG26 TaxID=3412477 RepID=UPI003CE51F69